MKNELLTQALRSTIPKLYEQEHATDPIVFCKLFNPYGNGTWFITEFDGEDTLFGYAKIHEGELGYISLKELEELPAYILGRWNHEIPGIELEKHFTKKPLSECLAKMEACT